MDRCNDRRELSELDPVTFFIVTELMRAQSEEVTEEQFESLERQVA